MEVIIVFPASLPPTPSSIKSPTTMLLVLIPTKSLFALSTVAALEA